MALRENGNTRLEIRDKAKTILNSTILLYSMSTFKSIKTVLLKVSG